MERLGYEKIGKYTRCTEGGGENEARKTEIVMGIKRDIERLGGEWRKE